MKVLADRSLAMINSSFGDRKFHGRENKIPNDRSSESVLEAVTYHLSQLSVRNMRNIIRSIPTISTKVIYK